MVMSGNYAKILERGSCDLLEVIILTSLGKTVGRT
jgi:hypothetical protein